jgi:hypothetical protein
MAKTKVDGSVARTVARICGCDLIVVDDIGMLPAGQDAAEAFYRIVDAAYERRSIAVTSNIHPSGFDTITPKTLATATVDRLLHHAHLVLTKGDYEPPPGAPLHRQVRLPAGELRQPTAENLPVRRRDPAPQQLTGIGVQHIERDLLPVQIQPTYDQHWDLLEHADEHTGPNETHCALPAEGVPPYVICWVTAGAYGSPSPRPAGSPDHCVRSPSVWAGRAGGEPEWIYAGAERLLR